MKISLILCLLSAFCLSLSAQIGKSNPTEQDIENWVLSFDGEKVEAFEATLAMMQRVYNAQHVRSYKEGKNVVVFFYLQNKFVSIDYNTASQPYTVTEYVAQTPKGHYYFTPENNGSTPMPKHYEFNVVENLCITIKQL